MPESSASEARRSGGRALATLVLGTALVATAGPAHALVAAGASAEPSVGLSGPTAVSAAAVAAAGPAPVYTPLGSTGLATAPTALADWAPDGSRLAYVSGSVVTTVHPDGSSPVTVSSTLNVNALAWSNRGARLALSASEVGKAGDLPQLWITTPLGVKAYKVTAPGATGHRTSGVTWLDGVTLVVASTTTGSSISRLSVVTLKDPSSSTVAWVPDDPSAALPTTSLLDPAGSPNGALVAYRQRVPDGVGGTVDSIWVAGRRGTGARKLVEAPALGRPVWSADNKTVFVERVTGASAEVLAVAAAGTTAATSLATGVGSSQVLARVPVSAGPATSARVTGTDHMLTSIAASKQIWPTVPAPRGATTASSVTLVNRGDWPDAAIAGPLAAATQGPLLFTTAKLDWRVAREIKRILPARGTVHLVGNTAQLPVAMVTLLRKMGYTVVRYTGKDAYATAVGVALRGLNKPTKVVFASLTSWQDAMIASAAAGRLGAALLFTRGAVQSGSSQAYVNLVKPGLYAIGTPAATAVPTAAVKATGADAGATSLAAAQLIFLPASKVMLATEAAAPDSMVAAATAARLQEPLLFTPAAALSPGLTAYLDGASGSVESVVAFGRPTVPAATVLTTAASLGAGRIG